MDTELEKAISDGVKKKKKDGEGEGKKIDEMEALAEDFFSAIDGKDKKKLARILRAMKVI